MLHNEVSVPTNGKRETDKQQMRAARNEDIRYKEQFRTTDYCNFSKFHVKTNSHPMAEQTDTEILSLGLCMYTVRPEDSRPLPIINPDQCTHAGVAAAHRRPREQSSTSTLLRTHLKHRPLGGH